MCSVQLKVRTMMRYLFSQGIYEWTDHIGIRWDERHRAMEIQANCPSYRSCRFPLIERRVVETDVRRFWDAQSFDLQLDPLEGNCDLCFLKARYKRVEIARRDPGSLDWWERQETAFAAKPNVTGDGKFFRKGQPYSYIRELANAPMLPFDGADTDMPCGCGDKGFVLSEQVNCEI